MFTCSNYYRGCRGRSTTLRGFCQDCIVLGLTKSPRTSPRTSFSHSRPSYNTQAGQHSPNSSTVPTRASTPDPENPLHPVAISTRSRVSSISSVGSYWGLYTPSSGINPSINPITMPSPITGPTYSAMSNAFASLANISISQSSLENSFSPDSSSEAQNPQ